MPNSPAVSKGSPPNEFLCMNASEKLVYMANQIARNLETAGPDHAARQTAEHIIAFWDPRMKDMILRHLESGGAGLSEIARAALTDVRANADA